jgi:hypothetical protein
VTEKKKIDPRDVASSTAVGAASRLGVARSRKDASVQNLAADEAIAVGAGRGAAKSVKAKPAGTSVLMLVGFVVLLFGMLALMLFMSGR